jgi:ubiquitin carboxyl-terminal hydrolase 7
MMKESSASHGKTDPTRQTAQGRASRSCADAFVLTHACLLIGGVQPLPLLNKGDTLLFFKYYDAARCELRYVGKLFANQNSKFSDIHEEMCAMAGLPPDDELLLFEEIKFEPNVMIEPVDPNKTLRNLQLEDGDIICFQRYLQPPPRFGTVPVFLDYVKHKQDVRFCKLESPKEDGITLELSKLHKYTEVCDRLATELNVSPELLRLTNHNQFTGNPRPHPFKSDESGNLREMLQVGQNYTDMLYYEVLDLPLVQVEQLKIMKVSHPKNPNPHLSNPQPNPGQSSWLCCPT